MKNTYFHARNWPGPKTYIRNPSAIWNIFFFPHLRKLFLFILWFIPWKNYWSPGPIWALMGPWRVDWFIRRVIGCRIKTDHRTIDTGPCKTWFVFIYDVGFLIFYFGLFGVIFTVFASNRSALSLKTWTSNQTNFK